jgi:hypothetical protein
MNRVTRKRLHRFFKQASQNKAAIQNKKVSQQQK